MHRIPHPKNDSRKKPCLSRAHEKFIHKQMTFLLLPRLSLAIFLPWLQKKLQGKPWVRGYDIFACGKAPFCLQMKTSHDKDEDYTMYFWSWLHNNTLKPESLTYSWMAHVAGHNVVHLALCTFEVTNESCQL